MRSLFPLITTNSDWIADLLMLTRKPREKNPLDFDALAFEQERERIFEQTEAIPEPALNASWDAVLGEEPIESNWLDPIYRAAYIESMTRKYDEKFGCAL